MEIRSGSRFPRSFVEYWKLVREDGAWVLEEIRQKDEFDIRSV